ncbi:hypothetical protein COO59_19165 [Mixta theicola]|uniref:Uncharacterized protein n=1 Tax=Mixta theicola TaxID=1458355 RepID=A0A2K1Q4Z2_9GAMM|nr:putative T6SS immunity periplasmic lipoprotein [Mixta theicola]PNS10108.1 hypothetical protein COO59_19165 [Mixta theicola]GLR08539.1 hypothetical protein GCM10007905_12580 [Mixta theicola]
MNIKVSCLGLVIFLSGCHLERPFYHPLLVKLEQEKLCFIVPEKNRFNTIIKVGAPYISLRNSDSWETVTLPEEADRGQEIMAGECIFWNKVKWQPGEYDVAVKIKNDDTQEERYSTHFILGENEQGRLFLKK